VEGDGVGLIREVEGAKDPAVLAGDPQRLALGRFAVASLLEADRGAGPGDGALAEVEHLFVEAEQLAIRVGEEAGAELPGAALDAARAAGLDVMAVGDVGEILGAGAPHR
jgi:hypothetical protein